MKSNQRSTVVIDTSSNIVAKFIEPEDRESFEAYRLRYTVYCEEKHFIDEQRIPNAQHIETDEYDENLSWHFVVMNTLESGEEHVIGTVRLVKYSEEKGFPTGKHQPSLYSKLGQHNKNEIAEISRLCINPCFRKRRDDDLYGVATYNSSEQRRKYPIVLLSLLREMYWFSKKVGIKFWLTSMEDSLYRYLKGISLEFQPLDENYIEYYGKVKSFLMGIEDAEKRLEEKRDDLYVYFKGNA
jgi:N-acyl amino acid synthase of PEP-CTERM/exosortase system